MKIAKSCSSCGKLTKYICIDCAIDKNRFIPLCEDPKCKSTHESEDCSKTNIGSLNV